MNITLNRIVKGVFAAAAIALGGSKAIASELPGDECAGLAPLQKLACLREANNRDFRELLREGARQDQLNLLREGIDQDLQELRREMQKNGRPGAAPTP